MEIEGWWVKEQMEEWADRGVYTGIERGMKEG
jgi:hypothetical protein